jgi:hypothetical protein
MRVFVVYEIEDANAGRRIRIHDNVTKYGGQFATVIKDEYQLMGGHRIRARMDSGTSIPLPFDDDEYDFL